jgi:hypothetical protein
MSKVSITARREKEELLEVPFDPVEFNKAYSDNQEEINRIFMHLFQKYPLGDGPKDAFNRLFVALAELKVFQRWSVARVVKSEVLRRTKNARKATAVYQRLIRAGNDEAERVAINMGINLKSKRGQFLYKWIEHILGQEYLQDGQKMRRMTAISPDRPICHTWRSDRHRSGFIPWSARTRDTDPSNYYEGAGAWGIAVNHDNRHFPHYEDVPTCVGDHTYSSAVGHVDTAVMQEELVHSITDGSDHTDRFIVSMRSKGYTVREIQTQLAPNGYTVMSYQAIQNRITRMRAKTTTQN